MTSLSAADIDIVAAEVSPPNLHALASASQVKAVPDSADDPWRLLYQVFSIHLRHENPAEPLGPMLVMDGRRSMVPADLTDSEVGLLRDVLWVARKDGRAGQAAVPAYLALGTALEDPEK